MSTLSFRKSPFFRYISFTVLTVFSGMLPVQPGWAQVAVVMPPVGQMIHITSHFEPPQMVGLKINPKNPFSFGFIMDQGQNPMSDSVKKEEFNKIVKYFLVSLAMPNKDMWVNLSPYESKRIIPEVFGQTEMGRDLLAQDYTLKQFTASLMYPEEGLGKKFWEKIYQESQARFGTTDINVNTFNKVWIVADHADVYQKGDTAFLVGSHLKVMLEQDYMAIEQNKEQFGDVNALKDIKTDAKTKMASQIVRDIIIPAIEKEVNDGESFAAVRQIYNAEIMATWFKKTLRASLLGQVFADKSKIAGQKIDDPQAKEKIFQQYLMAYKRGVFNYIKRETASDGQVIPRRYLSGGFQSVDRALVATIPPLLSEPAIKNREDHVIEDFVEANKRGGPQEVQKLIAENLAVPGINNITPAEMIIAISKMPISRDSQKMMIAAVADQLQEPDAVPSQRETQVPQLAEQLEKPLAGGPDALTAWIDKLLPNISSLPIEQPEKIVSSFADMNLPKLSDADRTRTIAGLVHQLTLQQPTSGQETEVKTFGENEESLATDKRLYDADVDLVSPGPAAEPAVTPTAGNFVGAMAERPDVSPQVMAALVDYFVNQKNPSAGESADREQLAGQFQQLRQVQAGPAAFRTLVSDSLGAQASTPVTVSDAGNLIKTIARMPEARPETVAALVENFKRPDAPSEESTPRIQELAGQIQQSQQTPEGAAATEELIDQNLAEAYGVTSAAPQAKPEKIGGINLSDEHLTMNIKVDGAGMPLPPQYQDKAMLNLNGLVSIIRSITPLTQQNVPALFELEK